MTWLIVRKELSGFFYHGLLILPERSSHMSLPVSSDSSKRKIPPGLVELLEGFVLVVLRDKPEDLVQYASQYFSSAQTRKNSLKEHGASVEELGVDFFTATNWNGLVWLSKGFQSLLKTAAAYVKISGVIAVNCTIMCCAGLQWRLAQKKTVIPFDRRKRHLSRAFPFETWFDLRTSWH